MKTKLYFAALALPLAFGACTNDDFETVSPNQGADGELVEVGPGFAISASKGGDDAATKGMWMETMNGTQPTLNYAWWPNYVLNEAGTGYNAVRDEIGLCWVGQSVGTNVYTNYRFQHAGWLNEDETTAEINPCDPYNIENGYDLDAPAWDGTTPNRFELKDNDAFSSNALKLLEGTFKEEGRQYLSKNEVKGKYAQEANKLNLNSAFFRTETETLFKGDYIAYLPFTPEMTEAGAVLAHSPKDVTVVLDEDASGNKQLKYAHLGSDMFMYAYAPGLVGGTQASNFSFKHLSGLIRIKAKADFSKWSSAGDKGLSGITSITLVDAAGKFVTEVGLDASKIVAEGNGASTGAALYVPGTEKYTNMLTAHLDNNNSKVVQGQTSEISIYIPALPTTMGQLSVVLYNHDLNLSAVYDQNDLTVSSNKVIPGQVTTIDMGLIDIEDFTQKVVTTEKALYQMAGTNGSESDGSIIRLMGDIELGTLTNNVDNNQGDNNVINTGWNLKKAVTLNGGKIIVPANFEWTIGSNATINSDIEIENRGCCEKKNGKLKIGTNNSNQKTTLNGTIDNYGDIVFEQHAADIATKNVTTITGKLNNHETLVPETGKTNYANITINTLTQVDLEGATVVNNADINILAKGNNASNNDGRLNLDKDAQITNHHNLSNAGNINNNGGKLLNEADGWIIDRISAQFGVTQPVNNGGQYVCEVNGQTRLNYALNKSLTTRVRFISLEAQANVTPNEEYGDKSYSRAAFDISGIQKPNVDFEVAKEGWESKEAIRLYSKDGSATEGAGNDVVIGNLIITSGALDVVNFTKYDTTKKDYVDATLKVKNIIVDGEKAYSSKLMVKNIEVSENVEVLNMYDNAQQLTIGGIEDANAAKGSFELTNMKVSGNFIVGSTNKEEVAAVAFNNNNTTDIMGSFSLYENAKCDIKVATSIGIDNWAAEVWASSIAVDTENNWVNGTKVKVGEHPLFQ